jgi:hypothetical protein
MTMQAPHGQRSTTLVVGIRCRLMDAGTLVLSTSFCAVRAREKLQAHGALATIDYAKEEQR